MSEEVIVSVVGVAGVVLGAIIQTVATASRDRLEAYRLAQQMQTDNSPYQIEQPKKDHANNPVPQKLEGKGKDIDDYQKNDKGRKAKHPNFHNYVPPFFTS